MSNLGIRSQVLSFAMEMERRLAENDHKNGKLGESVHEVLRELHRNVDELDHLARMVAHEEFDPIRMAALFEKAADVANFTMMVTRAAQNFHPLIAVKLFWNNLRTPNKAPQAFRGCLSTLACSGRKIGHNPLHGGAFPTLRQSRAI
jgi:hypothetical protein